MKPHLNERLHFLRLVLIPLSAILNALERLQVIEMISSTFCLGLGVIYIPSLLRIFPVGGFIDLVTKFVLPIKIWVLAWYDLTFVPNLVNCFLSKISHRQMTIVGFTTRGGLLIPLQST